MYKAEASLSRCIDSILSQMFIDFELLLIDDGSPDESGEICDKYAAKDNRIRVFHKENGGVSSARNMGLNHAKGEWITFVDSDDALKPDFILSLIKYKQYDLIIGGNIIIGELEIKREINQLTIIELEGPSAVLLDYDTGIHPIGVLGVPWGKLYRNTIISANEIRFDVNMFIGEDLCFVLNYMSHCKTVAFVPHNNYLYYLVKQESKYMMDYLQYSTHCESFKESIRNLEHYSKCTYLNMYVYTMESFFYRYYGYLKRCKTCIDYIQQTQHIREKGIKYLNSILQRERMMKRIYIMAMIMYPRLGYCISKLRNI